MIKCLSKVNYYIFEYKFSHMWGFGNLLWGVRLDLLCSFVYLIDVDLGRILNLIQISKVRFSFRFNLGALGRAGV